MSSMRAFASAAVLAAPRPFDPVTVGADEEIVLRDSGSGAPPLRLWHEAPLKLDGGGGDRSVAVNEAGSPNRLFAF